MTSSLRFWLKEATKFPIDNSILAINYLTEFYGSNIILGNNFINKAITKKCLDNLLERNIFIVKEDNWCLFTGQG
jgi:hypothetical protein